MLFDLFFFFFLIAQFRSDTGLPLSQFLVKNSIIDYQPICKSLINQSIMHSRLEIIKNSENIYDFSM